tara:strand:- start:475 stop:879 length:405 start_codon:yes stop_codon:yes gene_type:complete
MKLTVYADNHNVIPDTENSQSIHYSEANESPNAVFDEVEVFDALEYTGYDFINSMQQKVRHGGKIKFVGTDAIEVIRAIHSGSAELPEASKVLMSGRSHLTSVHDIKSAMESLGLKVGLVGIMGNRYSIEGVRG